MAQKFNSKNLTYDSAPPPFLAALKAQAAGSQGPDPILSSHRRPTKKRAGSEEAEDAPLVVDEDGNAIAVKVSKDGTVEETESKTGNEEQEASQEDAKDSKKDEDCKISFGARKRKVGKVIGDAASVEEDKTSTKETKETNNKKDDAVASDKKPKKKAKKIKLSFDED